MGQGEKFLVTSAIGRRLPPPLLFRVLYCRVMVDTASNTPPTGGRIPPAATYAATSAMPAELAGIISCDDEPLLNDDEP